MHSNLKLFYLIPVIFIVAACQNEKQEQNEIELGILWKLEKNFSQTDRPVHEAVFTLTNKSGNKLGNNWELYWNQVPREIISIDSTKNLEIERINGDYYRMRPTEAFSLAPDASLELRYISGVWMIKEADGPTGLYTVLNPGKTQQIAVVDDFTITPFTKAEQIHRSKNDKTPIPTAEYLFLQNEKLSELSNDQLYKVLPVPKAYEAQKGRFLMNKNISIKANDLLKNEADLLIADLKNNFGVTAQRTTAPDAAINIVVGKAVSGEQYEIEVDPNKIWIRAGNEAGAFYAGKTLMQLIEKEDNQLFIKACRLNDAPAYAYRGFHLDVARNFQTKEAVLKMIDIFSDYKVNKLVLCMTEDEGWRLEIDGLPELTQVGSKRGHPSEAGTHLMPAYGSGPFTNNPTGSGYYTREDFKEIIRYAKARHIDIIPMVNFPGHARAAIYAMEYRYKKLMQEGKQKEAEQYRLIDPEDQSVYLSAQHYNDNIVCIAKESVYNFYEFVVDDIIEMYKEAGVPLYMFHTGGDEVPRGAWLKSPLVREYLKDRPEINTTPEIQALFFDRITQMLKTKVSKVGGWEEVVMAYNENGKWFTNTSFTDRNVYPYIWNNLWGQQDLGYKIANRGYPVILCNVTNFYFDLAYDKDPREPGLYWGGFINTKDAFSFIPKDLFLSTTEDNMGNPLNPARDYANMERLNPDGRKNIIGLQAQLWSETIKGSDMFEYYVLPKLFGFAQRAWQGQPSWGNEPDSTKRNQAIDTDWNIFANTLSKKHFPKMDESNATYNYRIPAPGIIVRDGKLLMNAAYPGMEIRYTLNGEEPTKSAQVYEGPIDFEKGTVKAKVFNTKGRSGFTTFYSTDQRDMLN